MMIGVENGSSPVIREVPVAKRNRTKETRVHLKGFSPKERYIFTVDAFIGAKTIARLRPLAGLIDLGDTPGLHFRIKSAK